MASRTDGTARRRLSAEAADEATTVDDARRMVADLVESRLSAIVDEAVAHYGREIEEYATAATPQFADNVWRVTYATRQLEAAAVRSGRVPKEIPHDAEIGRLVAVAGLSQETVLRSYQVAGGVTWQAFLTATHEIPASPEIRAECVRQVAALLRAYEERLLTTALAAFRAEQAALSDSDEVAALRRVQRLVEGISEDGAGLGYELVGTHVALIATGPGADGAARAVRRALGAGERLIVRANDNEQMNTLWIWHRLEGEAAQPRALTGLLAGLELPDRVSLAVGEPGTGLDGFRESHRQASGAYVVGRRTGMRIARFREVAVELIALGDEVSTSLLAATELAGIDGDDPTSRKLRATLLAYFDSGQNAASAAARLGLSDQTVARHLRMVRERTGSYPQDRRAELEIALRYRRLLEGSGEEGQGLRLGVRSLAGPSATREGRTPASRG